MAGAHDLGGRHDLVPHDLLLVVKVVEEQVQRGDPLHEPRLYLRPLLRGYDPGNQVKGEYALRALGVVVDGERDSPLEKRQVHHGAALFEFRLL